jgi:hypothetical protein
MTPLQVLSIRAQTQRAKVADTSHSVSSFDIAWKQYLPVLRLEIDLSIGGVQRSFDAGSDWTWRAAAALRLSQAITLGGRAERAPYLYTNASFTTPVLTTSLSGVLDYSNPQGWLGQGGYEVLTFPDDNIVQRMYGWLMAPAMQTASVDLSIGYGFNRQHAREDRFTPLAKTLQPSGVYAPYYTPNNLQAHSVLVLIRFHLSSSVSLQINGSYGLAASENAPFFYRDLRFPAPLDIKKGFYERTFHPWTLRGVLTAPVSSSLSLTTEAMYWSTAYYDSKHLNLRLSYRFLSGDL